MRRTTLSRTACLTAVLALTSVLSGDDDCKPANPTNRQTDICPLVPIMPFGDDVMYVATRFTDCADPYTTSLIGQYDWPGQCVEGGTGSPPCEPGARVERKGKPFRGYPGDYKKKSSFAYDKNHDRLFNDHDKNTPTKERDFPFLAGPACRCMTRDDDDIFIKFTRPGKTEDLYARCFYVKMDNNVHGLSAGHVFGVGWEVEKPPAGTELEKVDVPTKDVANDIKESDGTGATHRFLITAKGRDYLVSTPAKRPRSDLLIQNPAEVRRLFPGFQAPHTAEPEPRRKLVAVDGPPRSRIA